jgi:hypothetical protein
MRAAAEIQADLTAAYESRRIALTSQEYSLDTGQGRQQVKRASLRDINQMIRDLELELDQAQAAESGAGIIAGNFRRY